MGGSHYMKLSYPSFYIEHGGFRKNLDMVHSVLKTEVKPATLSFWPVDFC